MSLPLIVRAAAEADLAQAKFWYEAERPGLGEEFLVRVEQTFERIRTMPFSSPEVFQGVRRVLLNRFPYAVFYRVEEEFISVIAVYHVRRHPRGWRERV